MTRECNYIPPEIAAHDRKITKIALASDEVLRRYMRWLKRIEDNTADEGIRGGLAHMGRCDAERELELRARERSFLGRALRFFRIPMGEKIII